MSLTAGSARSEEQFALRALSKKEKSMIIYSNLDDLKTNIKFIMEIKNDVCKSNNSVEKEVG